MTDTEDRQTAETRAPKTRSGLEKTHLRCSEHKQTVTKYCYTCEKFICEACLEECREHVTIQLYKFIYEIFLPSLDSKVVDECIEYSELMDPECFEEEKGQANWMRNKIQDIKKRETLDIKKLTLDELMALAFMFRKRGLKIRGIGKR